MCNLIAIPILCCLCLNSQALTLDFRAPSLEALDGSTSMTLNEPGLQVTIDAVGGVLNRTSRGFGVNAPGGADDADGIDGDVSDEAVRLSFSTPVLLQSLTLSGFSRTDIAELLFDGAATLVRQSGTLPLGYLLAAGESLQLAHLSGNGFSLDAAEVEYGTAVAPAAAASAVPEPPLAPLAALGLLSCLLHLRLRTRPGGARAL